MNFLIKTLSEREVDSLRERFEQLDTDGNGLVTNQELMDVLLA